MYDFPSGDGYLKISRKFLNNHDVTYLEEACCNMFARSWMAGDIGGASEQQAPQLTIRPAWRAETGMPAVAIRFCPWCGAEAREVEG